MRVIRHPPCQDRCYPARFRRCAGNGTRHTPSPGAPGRLQRSLVPGRLADQVLSFQRVGWSTPVPGTPRTLSEEPRDGGRGLDPLPWSRRGTLRGVRRLPFPSPSLWTLPSGSAPSPIHLPIGAPATSPAEKQRHRLRPGPDGLQRVVPPVCTAPWKASRSSGRRAARRCPPCLHGGPRDGGRGVHLAGGYSALSPLPPRRHGGTRQRGNRGGSRVEGRGSRALRSPATARRE